MMNAESKIKDDHFPFFLTSFLSHSKPSIMPSPFMPQHGWRCHVRLDLWRPMRSTSSMVRRLARSILFAKTSTGQLAISGCSITLSRVSLASEILSTSAESRTQMMALEPLQQWCQSSLSLVCPPMSQTVKLRPLQLTSSTLKPRVGTEATASLSFIWQRMVVLPAPSRPSMRILDFMSAKEFSSLLMRTPIQLIMTRQNSLTIYNGSRSDPTQKEGQLIIV